MQMTFTAADEAFREELRNFIEREFDPGTRERVEKGRGLGREDYVDWHRRLATMRFADGPDEINRAANSRMEFAKYDA